MDGTHKTSANVFVRGEASLFRRNHEKYIETERGVETVVELESEDVLIS